MQVKQLDRAQEALRYQLVIAEFENLRKTIIIDSVIAGAIPNDEGMNFIVRHKNVVHEFKRGHAGDIEKMRNFAQKLKNEFMEVMK